MGADFPDWGGQYNSSLFYPLFDMAELAARLGSPVMFDRRGSVIWLHTFEYGLDPVEAAVSGATSAFALEATIVHHAPFAGKLSAGNATNDSCAISFATTPTNDRYIGLACVMKSLSTAWTIQVIHRFTMGGHVYEGALKMILTSSVALEVNTPSGFVSVPNPNSNSYDITYWGFVKLVLDRTDKTYVRAIVGGHEIDLSAYSLRDNGASNANQLYLEIQIVTDANATKNLYIDTIILTSAEPPNS